MAARANSDKAFEDIRAEAEALRSKGGDTLWRDDEFPPGDASLFKDPCNPPQDWLRDGERGRVIRDAIVQWKGPENFCSTRRPLGKRADGTPTWLYSDADNDGVASCLDVDGGEVCQGSLGDCYFLCALAAAAKDMALADDLIDEEFEDVGIYGVSFWTAGHWEMVWVDRNFPCYRPAKASHSGRWRLVFASCEDPKEIWPLVVEKAYAKLHGNYEALSGGRIGEALCAITGGRTATMNLQSPFANADCTFAALADTRKLTQAGKRFVGAGSLQSLEEPQAKGIVSAHAYTVLDAVEVAGVRLVRLRNPWNKGEWKGDWSDSSAKWRTDVGRQLAKEVKQEANDDGEFWMSLEDFCVRFQTLDLCDVDAEGHEERLAALKASLKTAGDAGRVVAAAEDERSIDDLLAEIEGTSPPKKGKNRDKKKKDK